MSSLPPISTIAASFSRAASHYDNAASLQRLVADNLLDYAQPLLRGSTLDIGCGTGYLCESLSHYPHVTTITGLDVAPGMINYAQAQLGTKVSNWLVGDAQTLALPPLAYDTMISSLTIQWCAELDTLFANLHAAIKPDGHLCLATLGPNTMHELRSAWQAVDDYQHVNDFVPADTLTNSLQSCFTNVQIHRATITQEYVSIGELLQSLKHLGVSNHNQGARQGLTTKTQLRAMQATYETMRQSNGYLPLSYDVIYILAQVADNATKEAI